MYSRRCVPLFIPLLVLLLTTSIACAGGGVEPQRPAPVKTIEKPTAPPDVTSAALQKARQAVAPKADTARPLPKRPTPPPVTVVSPSRTTTTTASSGWLIRAEDGTCKPLDSVRRNVKSLGDFRSPDEFGKQLRQRGYQVFVMKLDETLTKVKVPDMDLELMFVRAETCR